MKQVHIITGGSSGIGLECAARFTEGVVLITGRRTEVLADACKKLKDKGVDAHCFACDISDQASVSKLFSHAASLGRIKTVVNSAGVSSDTADIDSIIKIDLLGAFHITMAFMPFLTDGSVLILMSSIMGHLVPPNPAYDNLMKNPDQPGIVESLKKILNNDAASAYNMTKRGVHLLVHKYAGQFGQKGARIISVSPGIILTPMGEQAIQNHPEQLQFMKSITPLKCFGQPEDIAYMVEFLASDKARFITGSDFLVDGGSVSALINMPKPDTAKSA